MASLALTSTNTKQFYRKQRYVNDVGPSWPLGPTLFNNNIKKTFSSNNKQLAIRSATPHSIKPIFTCRVVPSTETEFCKQYWHEAYT
jgi:hypothetical protein